MSAESGLPSIDPEVKDTAEENRNKKHLKNNHYMAVWLDRVCVREREREKERAVSLALRGAVR